MGMFSDSSAFPHDYSTVSTIALTSDSTLGDLPSNQAPKDINEICCVIQ